MLLNNHLPAVPVHDLVVHPREKGLVVGTHGRSIYIGSVKELQQLTDEVMAKALHAFSPNPVSYSSNWGNTDSWWKQGPPEVKLPIYTNSAGKAKVSIIAGEDLLLHPFEADCSKGLNYFSYDLIISGKNLAEYNKLLNKDRKEEEKPANVKPADDGKVYLYKGKYKVVVEKDGEQVEMELEVK
jgi:hypothetical protein